jgi:hypothetical protein
VFLTFGVQHTSLSAGVALKEKLELLTAIKPKMRIFITSSISAMIRFQFIVYLEGGRTKLEDVDQCFSRLVSQWLCVL